MNKSYVGEAIAGMTFRNSWPTKDQWASHALLVDILFTEESMAPHGQSVVSGVDNQRIVGVRTILQGGKNAAYLFVKMRDQAIVFAELIADHVLCPRPRS